MGLETFEPRGAFYAFPRITSTGLDAETFARRLLEEEHVAVIPGGAFGPSGEDHVRACYATSYERLEEALARIGRFVRALPNALGRRRWIDAAGYPTRDDPGAHARRVCRKGDSGNDHSRADRSTICRWPPTRRAPSTDPRARAAAIAAPSPIAPPIDAAAMAALPLADGEPVRTVNVPAAGADGPLGRALPHDAFEWLAKPREHLRRPAPAS